MERETSLKDILDQILAAFLQLAHETTARTAGLAMPATVAGLGPVAGQSGGPAAAPQGARVIYLLEMLQHALEKIQAATDRALPVAPGPEPGQNESQAQASQAALPSPGGGKPPVLPPPPPSVLSPPPGEEGNGRALVPTGGGAVVPQTLPQVLQAAQENLAKIAALQVLMAAQGKITESSWEDQAKALEYINSLLEKQSRLKLVGKDADEKKPAVAPATAPGKITPYSLSGMAEHQVIDLTRALRQFSMEASTAFATAKAGILSFVAAGNPVAFDTFTQSVGLFSAEVGGILMPIVIQAADWIQDLAHWIDGLDRETKDSIVTWAGVGVAVLGAATAFAKAYQLGTMVVSMLGAIRTASLALIATPWGALLAALGAVLAAALAISGAFSNSAAAMEKLANQARTFQDILAAEESGEKATGKELEKVLEPEEKKRLLDAGNDQKKRMEIVRELYDRTRREEPDKVERLSAEQVEERAARLRAELEQLQKGEQQDHAKDWTQSGAWYNAWGAPSATLQALTPEGRELFKRAQQRTATKEGLIDAYAGGRSEEDRKALRDALKVDADKGAMTDEAINTVVEAFKHPFQKSLAKESVLKRIEAQGEVPDITGGKQHLRARPVEIAAQYQSFAGAHQMFQIAALQKSPIETEQMRIQRQSYIELEKIRKATQGTEKKLPIVNVGR